MISLHSPVAAVLGDVKGKREKIEKNLRIETVGDLLRHFPRRYVDTANLTRIDQLHHGQMLTVIGEIVHSEEKSYRDKRTGRTAYRLETVLRTQGPELRMTFFAKSSGMSRYHAKRYHRGRRGLFVGQASQFRGEWQLTNPRSILFGRNDDDSDEDRSLADSIGALYPIYPLTKGIDTWDLQRAVAFARTVVDDLPELLPESVRRGYAVPDVHQAYEWIHSPADRRQVADAERRFRFEEALVTQVVLARRRRAMREVGAQARDGGDGALLAAFDEALPFELTTGQRSIGRELEHDLARPWPMNRLLQGEVGSGKTIVALRAMLRVVDSGGQCALLAPTEVLAQQHHRSISAMLGDLVGGGMFGGTTVELLTGSMTKTQRTGPMSRLASGEAGIVIGTHALLEDTVQFADLGLVVVDEQHRFGVEQRAALTDKAGEPPHVLVMTATPIPRTVAMTVFGDLETSILAELPAGRAPIQTNVVDLVTNPAWLDRVWERVREEVAKGHQVYVLCPRISGDELEQGEVDVDDDVDVDVEEDDDGQQAIAVTAAVPPHTLAAVEEVVLDLSLIQLPGLRVAAMHGRMTPDVKDSTMRAFADGEVDVLVSTTVIEVGVDVHNATAMVILDADRFGVSQLHQLRGRVGRGGLPGLCLLVSHAPPGTPARTRLDAVASTTDGFELSRVDLDLRREGDVLGRSQSGGRSTLENLRVLRDEDTIVEAREAAEALLDADPLMRDAPVLAEHVALLEATHGDFIEKS